MKKVLLIATSAFFFFSCSNDSSSESSRKSVNDIESSNVFSRKPPCPPGTFAEYSYDFDYAALHRGSTNCTSRFSFCIKGDWVRDCVPNPVGKLSNYDTINKKVSVVGVLSEDNKSMTLHFPIEMLSLPTFKREDFDTFGFDEEYVLDEGVTIKTGEYIPSYTTNEIIVIVNLL